MMKTLFVCIALLCLASSEARSSAAKIQQRAEMKMQNMLSAVGEDIGPEHHVAVINGELYSLVVNVKGLGEIVTFIPPVGKGRHQLAKKVDVTPKDDNEYGLLVAHYEERHGLIQITRRFKVMDQHTLIWVGSSEAHEQELLPAVFTEAVKPHFPNDSKPNPLDKYRPMEPVILRVTSFLNVYTTVLADFLEEGKVMKIDGLESINDIEKAFQPAVDAWKTHISTKAHDKCFGHIILKDADECVEAMKLLPDAADRAVENLLKWARTINRLDLTTCNINPSDDPALVSLDSQKAAADAFNAMTSEMFGQSYTDHLGKQDEQQLTPDQQKLAQLEGEAYEQHKYEMESKQYYEDQGFEGSTAKQLWGAQTAGADALVDVLVDLIDSKIAEQKPEQGYLDFFYQDRLERGEYDDPSNGKVLLSKLVVLRQHMDTELRRSVGLAVQELLMHAREQLLDIENWTEHSKERVEAFGKEMLEYGKALISMESDAMDKKKRVADMVMESEALSLGEDAIALQMFQAAATVRMQKCARKIADLISEFERVEGLKWKNDSKFKVKVKADLQDIVKEIGIEQKWKFYNSINKHEIVLKANVVNPTAAGGEDTQLELEAGYRYENANGISAGFTVSPTIQGLYTSPSFQSIGATAFVSQQTDTISQAFIIGINVPFDENGALENAVTYTFSYSLDVKLGEKWRLSADVSGTITNGGDRESYFEPSEIATYDATISVGYLVSPMTMLSFSANAGQGWTDNLGVARYGETRQKFEARMTHNFTENASVYLNLGIGREGNESDRFVGVGFRITF